MVYALCNDGTRIYLDGSSQDLSARCEVHGNVGRGLSRDSVDWAMNAHAANSHQGMHSHACPRT